MKNLDCGIQSWNIVGKRRESYWRGWNIFDGNDSFILWGVGVDCQALWEKWSEKAFKEYVQLKSVYSYRSRYND
jgi:hypothetical protein